MKKILENKTALITGSGRGIGKALAIGFAKLGADLILTSRTMSEIDEVKKKIEELGQKAIAVTGDIQNYEEIDNVAKKGIEEFGKIDVLINNAGYSKIKPITRLRVEEFQKILKTNVIGVYNATHCVVPYMIQNKGGSIINTGSLAVTLGMPSWSVYAMSKSALLSFTTCLAEELKSDKIKVNTIMPNMVHTPMLHRGRTPEQIEKLDAIQPEQLVPFYAFLASDENKRITGLNINVDLIKSVVALREKVSNTGETQKENIDWNLIEPLAKESLTDNQFRDARKAKKLINFLLKNIGL